MPTLEVCDGQNRKGEDALEDEEESEFDEEEEGEFLPEEEELLSEEIGSSEEEGEFIAKPVKRPMPGVAPGHEVPGDSDEEEEEEFIEGEDSEGSEEEIGMMFMLF